jgi:hypothetical protein
MSTQSLDKIFEIASRTPGISELKGLILSGKSELDLGRRKGYSADLLHEMQVKAIGRISAHCNLMRQREQARISKLRDEHKKRYELHYEGDPGRGQQIERLKIKYAAMSDSELQAIGGLYSSGKSEIFDPAEVELLCANLKPISKALFQHVRESALKQNYRAPWEKLLSETDRKTETIIAAGQIPLLNDRGDGRELEVMGMT